MYSFCLSGIGSHMRCINLTQTRNHASIPPVSFLQAGSLPAAQPTVSEHWRQES